MKKIERQTVIFIAQIIIILSFIISVLVAVNLRKTFREVRNLVRARHMETILNAVYTYYLINGEYPPCIPEKGHAIDVRECKEIEPFLTVFPQDPFSNQKYLIEYLDEEKRGIRIFSSAPEAKGVEVVR